MLIRLSITGEYSRYVQPGMRIPLLIAGLILTLIAAIQLSGKLVNGHTHDHDSESDSGPGSASIVWLLLFPILAVLVVAPPPLGGWGLDRQTNQAAVDGLKWSPLTLTEEQPVQISLPDFVGRSLETGAPTVSNVEVELIGFVNNRSTTSFTLARYSIACCAADAQASQVRVIGATLKQGQLNPNTLQWVKVVGTLSSVDGVVPVLAARQLTVIDEPNDPYI
jgi:uncharacterized repeat protein (TIGR03943 family)